MQSSSVFKVRPNCDIRDHIRNSHQHRTKTEGDCDSDPAAGNIYGKLLDIKQKYKHNRHNTSTQMSEHVFAANENRYERNNDERKKNNTQY